MRDPKTLLRGLARRAYLTLQRLRPRPNASDGSSAAETTTRLGELTAARDHTAAVELITRELEGLGSDTGFLDQARRSASRAGEPALQARATRAQIAATPTIVGPARARLVATLAQVEGRLLETDPAWTPTVPAVAPLPRREGGSAPLRVAHLLKIALPHRQSGYSVRTRYNLAAQAEAGIEPMAITALDFPGDDGPEVEDVHGIRHRHLRRTHVPGAETVDGYLDAYAQALVPTLADEAPDLLHVHSGARGYEAALVGRAAAQALGLPWVYEVRGFFEAIWSQDLERAETAETYHRRRDTDTRCMLAADAVITLSQSMRSDIIGRGVPADRVHVVPNGVDATAFAPRERRADLVEQYGLAGRFVFGYVSNLDHYREGQEYLIDAALALRQRGIDAVALIVGDGTRRAELEAHALEVGAGDAVVFTGRVPHDEVLDHYALLDLFVVPRVDERAARLVTPLKPFEAMAAGLPVLVSDLPALTEITGDGQRGESFAVGDADALADALVRLAGDPQRRAELAAAGRAWVETERSWAANGERYRAIYDAVLDR
ncbi:MAG: glycosyltransferase family 4 protein [Janibacter sp.]